jgi:PhzF family phenazine biosynthesis protein
MHTFYIVDVFAEKKYAGNQLAVFRTGRDFSKEEMQAIAREMNFSETTFIDSDAQRDGGFDVRIFTPAIRIKGKVISDHEMEIFVGGKVQPVARGEWF